MTKKKVFFFSFFFAALKTQRPSLHFKPIENSMTGNKFGNGVEFREGAPIQLLEFKEGPNNGNFGKIVLNPEALEILQTIREPLAIISVGR